MAYIDRVVDNELISGSHDHAEQQRFAAHARIHRYAFTRPDGVAVIPIGALGP